jgi:hypothetical protein
MGQTQRLSGRATRVWRDPAGTLVVQYHNTEVVTASADGKVVLRTGGWQTATTRTRMNQAANQFQLGYSVFQKDFNWFVTWRGKTIPFNSEELVLS